MGHGLVETLLAWVQGHPLAALALVAAVAFGESLFLFGLLIPGALFMFAFGALVGAGALPLGATFIVAIIGTLAGDTTSYILGRAYRGRVRALPGLSQAPELVARAESFLARHGGKGIVVGRLIGALRPIMPTVAGASGLSPLRFAIMDLLATALWAPCYVLPGIVFGASLDLAAQVATRLAILLLAVVAIVWATAVAARYVLTAGRVVSRRYAVRLLAWSRRHRRLGLLGPALADPYQPELPALAVAASLLMAVIATLYLIVWGWSRPVYPLHLDALVFYLSQSLHNAISDPIAYVIAEIGSPLIYLPFAAMIAGVLVLMGNWRTAGHWVAALGFSALAAILLRWWLAIPAPITFFRGADADPLFLAGGGQDLILCATVYGLAGMVVAARSPITLRPYYHSITIAGVVLIALARLYLGLDWASDTVVGLPLAFVWLNVLILCYRRQKPELIRGRPVLTALSGCIVIALLAATLPGNPARSTTPKPKALTPRPLPAWNASGHRALDPRIKDIAGRRSAPLNVQAAGDRQRLSARLARGDWRVPPALTPAQPLRWLAPGNDIAELAVLPRIHDGRQPSMTRVHAVTGKPHTRQRWVLRLWPTRRITETGQPLWVGLVDAQGIYRRFHLLSTAVDRQAYDAAVRQLATSLSGTALGFRMVSTGGRLRLLFWSPAAGDDAKVIRHQRSGRRIGKDTVPKAGPLFP